jgi:hypothetical protein
MIKKIEIERFRTANHFQEDPMNADVLTTEVADGIAVITLGSARRIYFDEEMGDALTEALDGFAGDAAPVVTSAGSGRLHQASASATPPRRRCQRDWHSKEISS